jgi:Zinc finger, C2H2 type
LDERDFVCHICSKAFYRRDALKKHISCYHENIKAFHCPVCNKMFKGHLPQHMRTHQSIKTHVTFLTCLLSKLLIYLISPFRDASRAELSSLNDLN